MNNEAFKRWWDSSPFRLGFLVGSHGKGPSEEYVTLLEKAYEAGYQQHLNACAPHPAYQTALNVLNEYHDDGNNSGWYGGLKTWLEEKVERDSK